MTGLTRRGMLAGLLASAAAPAFAQAPKASLRPPVRGAAAAVARADGPEVLLARASLSGETGFAVADAGTGLLLEGHNLHEALPPASVAKAITALYALEMLGPEHRFVTRIIATGGVANGEVQGDLVLSGGGDPTLETDTLAQMAAALKAAGVRAVKGAFLVHDGAFPRLDEIDHEQPPHVAYNPGVSGIALNFNRVHFQWKRGAKGYSVTMDARSEKYRPDVAMARMAVAERGLPVYTYADGGGTDEWTVARRALGKDGSRWLPVKKPGLYAGDVLATMARSHGIVLKPARLVDTAPEGKTLVAVDSPPLTAILKDMLKYSTNLTAEMVGLAATCKRVGPVASLRASAAEMNAWAQQRLRCDGLAMVDHSGLSGQSRVMPEDMVRVLVTAHRDTTLRPILKPVAMRDAKGRPVKDHPVKVDAKTGTLNFVSGLAGYVTATDGRELAFAIFSVDETARGRVAPEERDAAPGAQPWNTRAKGLQLRLLERWGTIYGS